MICPECNTEISEDSKFCKECLLKAVDCFERCEAETILKQTREELNSLG